MIWLLTYFIIGVILDIMTIIDFKATQKNMPKLASIVQLIRDYAGWMVAVFILKDAFVIANDGGNLGYVAIDFFVYCLGGSVGSYIGMTQIVKLKKFR